MPAEVIGNGKTRVFKESESSAQLWFLPSAVHPSTQPHYGPKLATGRSLTKPLTLKHLGMDGRFNPV